MATMGSLIGLVNRIQQACTMLGDHGGGAGSLWESLPSVAVVGGQVRALPPPSRSTPPVAQICSNNRSPFL
jgi:hypothetical protein